MLLLVSSLTGCAKALAEAEPMMPELSPPPPPPRAVGMYIDGPVPTVEPSPSDTALTAPPVPPPVRAQAARPEPPRVEPPRVEPERPVVASPALTLRPAPGPDTKTLESIRGLLDRATRDLQRVNYAALDADGRTQFDITRGFIRDADQALKHGNLPYAGKLADKAATMAAVLIR